MKQSERLISGGDSANSVAVLLARREWLLKAAAAADERWIEASRTGAPRASELDAAAKKATDAWFAVERAVAAAPAICLDEVIAKLAIAAEAFRESAGSDIEDMPSHERLVVGALADLRRLAARS